MATPLTTPALRGIARRPARPAAVAGPGRDTQERCDLCSEPLPPTHGHLLELTSGGIHCACRACALLFDRDTAGGGHYRLLPDRRRRLDSAELDGALHTALGIPVDLAFFVRSGADGQVTAHYPSPLGTLRSPVDPQLWAELAAAHPVLREPADDVEALLADHTGGARRHWLLPLDDCYRLAALVRTHWKGLGGGPDVRRHLDDFFDRLDGKEER